MFPPIRRGQYGAELLTRSAARWWPLLLLLLLRFKLPPILYLWHLVLPFNCLCLPHFYGRADQIFTTSTDDAPLHRASDNSRDEDEQQHDKAQWDEKWEHSSEY